MILIRCNHCGRSHRSDYCIASGKIPDINCPEDDINLSNFQNDYPKEYEQFKSRKQK